MPATGDCGAPVARYASSSSARSVASCAVGVRNAPDLVRRRPRSAPAIDARIVARRGLARGELGRQLRTGAVAELGSRARLRDPRHAEPVAVALGRVAQRLVDRQRRLERRPRGTRSPEGSASAVGGTSAAATSPDPRGVLEDLPELRRAAAPSRRRSAPGAPASRRASMSISTGMGRSLDAGPERRSDRRRQDASGRAGTGAPIDGRGPHRALPPLDPTDHARSRAPPPTACDAPPPRGPIGASACASRR